MCLLAKALLQLKMLLQCYSVVISKGLLDFSKAVNNTNLKLVQIKFVIYIDCRCCKNLHTILRFVIAIKSYTKGSTAKKTKNINYRIFNHKNALILSLLEKKT